jgi:hypothetical protein
LQENGAVCPGIDLAAYKVTVWVQPSNNSEATFGIMNIQQSGSNISFQVYVSMAGRPSTDNKFYGNIIIGLEAIP